MKCVCCGSTEDLSLLDSGDLICGDCRFKQMNFDYDRIRDEMIENGEYDGSW